MKKIFVPVILIIPFIFQNCSTEKASENITAELKDHVTFLASDELEGRQTGSEGEQIAIEYISNYFGANGLKPAGTEGFLQVFYKEPAANPHEEAKVSEEGKGTAVTNVVALLDNPGKEIIIIGAHHDHLGMGGSGSLYRGDSTAIHNGADDNASGVAIVLSLAKKLQKQRLNTDILFITFSGEEKGLWGSNYFAKNPTVDFGKVKAMINMDMVGKLNEDKSMVVHGTGTSPIWNDLVNEVNKDSLDIIMKPSGVGPSDHTSFYLQDLPVLHLFTGQHEDYHKPSDDSEKLNYEGMELVAKYIERIVIELDKIEEIAFTKTKEDTNNTPRFTVTLGVIPDYLFNGEGMRIDGVSEGKPAAKAGIEKGDIVLAMGDSIVDGMKGYMNALSALKKGDQTKVKVLRKGEELEFDVEF